MGNNIHTVLSFSNKKIGKEKGWNGREDKYYWYDPTKTGYSWLQCEISMYEYNEESKIEDSFAEYVRTYKGIIPFMKSCTCQKCNVDQFYFSVSSLGYRGDISFFGFRLKYKNILPDELVIINKSHLKRYTINVNGMKFLVYAIVYADYGLCDRNKPGKSGFAQVESDTYEKE